MLMTVHNPSESLFELFVAAMVEKLKENLNKNQQNCS